MALVAVLSVWCGGFDRRTITRCFFPSSTTHAAGVSDRFFKSAGRRKRSSAHEKANKNSDKARGARWIGTLLFGTLFLSSLLQCCAPLSLPAVKTPHGHDFGCWPNIVSPLPARLPSACSLSIPVLPSPTPPSRLIVISVSTRGNHRPHALRLAPRE